MAHAEFRILSPSDQKLVESFQEIWKSLGSPSGATCTLYLLQSGGAISVPIGDIAANDALREILALSSTVFRIARLNLSPVPLGLTITRDEGYDKVRVDVADNTDPSVMAHGMAVIRKSLHAFDPLPQLDRLLGPELTEFYRRREEGLVRLEGLAQDLVRQGIAYRESLDARLEEERGRLKSEVEVEGARLDAERKRRDEDLASREERLAKQLEELDNRSNTHVRRQLRADLKKILADRNTKFALTRHTSRKRVPIHVLFGLLILAAGALAGRTLWHMDSATDWISLARLSFSTLTFIGALGFYIRWNDRWAQKHADEEFKLKRLEVDIDRASWVVEMALEWKEERGSQIPPELVDRLTRNLFQEDGKQEAVRHPGEDVMAALIAASAGLRVTLPGLAEVSLDRKGVKRFQDSLKDREQAQG